MFRIFILFFFLSISSLAQVIKIDVSKDNMMTSDSIFINGQFIKGRLIFDTGSGTTILDKHFSQYLSKHKSAKDNLTYYGKIEQTKAVANSLQIGDLKIKDQSISFLDMSHIIGDCNPNQVIGILGLDIIKQYHWKFDFDENNLYFDKNKGFDVFGYEPYKIKMKYTGDKLFSTNKANHLPIVELEMDEKPIDFIFDTGSFGGIYIRKKQNEIRKDKTLLNERFRTVGTNASLEKIGASSFGFGNKPIKVTPVYSSLIETSIGTGFLRHFDVVIDKGFQTVFLKQKDEIMAESQDIKYGFSLTWADGQLIIVSIYKDSPAYNNGLRIFDKIAVINNKSYTDLSSINCEDLKELTEEFDKPQMKITLVSGKQLTIKQSEK